MFLRQILVQPRSCRQVRLLRIELLLSQNHHLMDGSKVIIRLYTVRRLGAAAFASKRNQQSG